MRKAVGQNPDVLAQAPGHVFQSSPTAATSDRHMLGRRPRNLFKVSSRSSVAPGPTFGLADIAPVGMAEMPVSGQVKRMRSGACPNNLVVGTALPCALLCPIDEQVFLGRRCIFRQGGGRD